MGTPLGENAGGFFLRLCSVKVKRLASSFTNVVLYLDSFGCAQIVCVLGTGFLISFLQNVMRFIV